MLSVGDVLTALTEHDQVPEQRSIVRAVIDSREVVPGAFFVALLGENTDGHDYVSEAFQAGAVLALIEREVEGEHAVLDLRKNVSEEDLKALDFPICLRVENSLDALQQIARHWRSQLTPQVIGITGSVGKSTTKELTAEVLEQRFHTFRNPGNLNNEIGLPLSMLSLAEDHEQAVFEMGFYVPGEISLLCEIARPHVGVITNVSQVHLERAKTMEAIIKGKTELVEHLPAAPEGTAILNYDEELVRNMAKHTQAQVFYYGLSTEADLWADEVQGLGLEGVRFVLHYQGRAYHVRVPLLGRHSVHTALRATAVGLVQGLSWEEIVNGLKSEKSQLRLVSVQGPDGSLLLDDTYNAAPPSVIAALNLLAELDGKRIAVLGDMLELGDFEERGHRMVGVRAAQVVDELITVGERAQWIADEAQKAGLASKNIQMLKDSEEATNYLRDHIGERDVILVKGSRGLRMDKIVSALEERQ